MTVYAHRFTQAPHLIAKTDFQAMPGIVDIFNKFSRLNSGFNQLTRKTLVKLGYSG